MPYSRFLLATLVVGLVLTLFSAAAHADLPHAIVVADDVADRVMMFDPYTGDYTGDLLTADPEGDELSAPFDCEIGPAVTYDETEYPDTVLISDVRYQRVVAYDATTGLYIKPFITGARARGIAYATDGRLLVATDQGVRAYSTSGAFVGTRVARNLRDGPYNAWDVLVRPNANDGQGDMLVSDVTLDVILRFDLSGERLGVFAELESFQFVEQLAERASGNILAVDVFGDAVHEFDAGGTFVRTISVTRPRGIVELFNGNLLIASEDGVQEFDGGDGALIATKMAGYPDTAPRYARYLRCRTSALRGDVNGDWSIDGFDIDPFVLAIQSAADFAAQYPSIDRLCVADINRDGAVDGFDIDPFIVLLFGE